MAALLKYTPQMRQSQAVPVAAAPQAQAPQIETGGAEVFRSVDDFMRTAGPIMGGEYRRRETARADEQVSGAAGKFAAWQERYEQEMQGRRGLDAAADYAAAWEEISSQAEEEFGGSGHEIFAGLLKQRLKEKGESVVRAGMQFAGRQRAIWEQSQWEGQQAEFARMVQADPYDAEGIIREREALKGSWAAKNPGRDGRAVFAKIDEQAALGMAEAMLAREDTEGVRALLAGGTAGGLAGAGRKLGDVIASEESGGDGVLKVGYDRNGGTSYGKWQLSSKQGSYQEWLRYLGTAEARGRYGEEACREIAGALAGAGPANTGTSSGRHAAVYQELARKYPEVMEESQRDFLKASHYDGALGKLPAGLRQMIEGDRALQEMVFSTAVQMGPAGCARILNGVWHEGMGREELVRAAYARRGQPENFKSSTAQVRQSVAARMGREAETILGMGAGGGPAGPGGLMPGQAQALLRKADAIDGSRQRAMQAQMRNGLAQYQAASEDGHIMDMPYSEAQVLAAFGPEQGALVWRDLNESRELAMDMASMKSMSLGEISTFMEARRPDAASPSYRDDMRRHGKLAQLAGALQERMRQDGAAYVLETYEPAARARQDFISNLNNLTPEAAGHYADVMEGALAQRGLEGNLFSKADARAIGEAVMGAADPVAAAQNLTRAFGPRAGRVLRELTGSLSPTMSLIASGMNPEAARLLLRAEREKDFEKTSAKVLQLAGSDKTDFEQKVWAKCAELGSTFLAGDDRGMAVALRSATAKLALAYMQRLALKPGDAIERAYNDAVGDRYEIVKRGGFFARAAPPCRIPRALPVKEIKQGMEAVLAAAPMDMIAAQLTPGGNEEMDREALREGIARNGHWVTDEDEGGAVLFLGTRPVWTREGTPLRFTWQQLAEAGREWQKADAYESELIITGGTFYPQPYRPAMNGQAPHEHKVSLAAPEYTEETENAGYPEDAAEM